MKLEEYLGIWQLKSNGESVPYNYNALCREIEKLDPDEVGYRIIQRLEAEGFISTLADGRRILTAEGLSKRIPLPVRPVIEKVDDEKAWERFRRLCGYYADCVTQSEKQQEYLFKADLDIKYLMPVLDNHWTSADQPLTVNYSQRSQHAVNRIKARRETEEDVYIGYPLSVFPDVHGKMVYSPILLFPVDIAFDNNSLQIAIRQDEVDINRTWLEFNVPRSEQKEVQAGICFSEGAKTGLLNTDTAIQYIANRFNVALNPDMLDYSICHRSRGIANSAVLFIGAALKYSKTLKKELHIIAKQPAAVLNQTALAYVFRDPPLANRFEAEQIILPFDFLSVPSNHEQHKALEEALNYPVSKITGPPGTGKSQIAVNLIANLVFNGQSVLFTSKNHKAIHAIYERADEAVRMNSAENVNLPIPPLIQFCSTPDGQNGAEWNRQQLDLVLARNADLREHPSLHATLQLNEKFADTLDNYRDWHKEIAEINAARSKMQEIQAKYDFIRETLPDFETELTSEFAARIKHLAGKIGIFSDDRSFWRKVLDCLLFRKYQAFNAERELRKLFPALSRESKSPETLRKRVIRLCGIISDWLAVKEEEKQLAGKNLDLPEETLVQLARDVAFRRDCLKQLLLFRRVTATDEISPDTVQTLKSVLQRAAARNTLPFLTRILDTKGENADWAQGRYAIFTKFSPAWAATLLSLSKASPCIAGAFDRVIIDEASQCEIPPIIPALFRSKSVTIIGDPNQFPPVITLRAVRHHYVRRIKHKLNDLPDDAFDFLQHNAFDIISVPPLLLREHFRCHEDIAAYFNEEYYGNKLRVRTNPKHLKFPQNMGFQQALVWRDITDSLENEIAEAKSLFQDLQHNCYKGSVGVISPFRKVADRLKQELYNIELPEFNCSTDVNTANGFQGGERDLIVFVLGYTSNLKQGEDWYAIADENRYIYNVAVSRARACLIVVGDRNRAQRSASAALRNLAKDLKQRPPRRLSQSPGEEMLYRALCKAGLVPVQQYPLAGRFLDMALVDEKIDIEVDGEGFHLNRYGERKQDDIYRDLQITSLGWRVCRFWYREVRDQLDSCVEKIKTMVTQA
jgi:very-short-patch-repair endonuclease